MENNTISRPLNDNVSFDNDNKDFGTELFKIYIKDTPEKGLNVNTLPNPKSLQIFDKEFLNFIARGIQITMSEAFGQLTTADGKRVFKQKNKVENK